jgi:hypothetical protein
MTSLGTSGIWQIGMGPASASIADVFLKYGVALVGPGDAGSWRPERNDAEFEGPLVQRFVSEVKEGDVFLLRTGVSRIRAVGLVASEYLYLEQFDEVNGQDLQHARRVRWCPLPQEYDFESPIFGGLPQRFSRAWNLELQTYVERFLNSPPTRWQSAALPVLPPEEPELTEVPAQLRDVVAQVADLATLYWEAPAFGEPPTEDELVAHFVVPLVRALGWPPERIGIKWRRIDVALFLSLPRTPENCFLVIEAKRLSAGVEGALDQAKGYVESLGVPRDIVVTDGMRYRMYAADRDFAAVAYANLRRLKLSSTDLFSRLKNREGG